MARLDLRRESAASRKAEMTRRKLEKKLNSPVTCPCYCHKGNNPHLGERCVCARANRARN